MNLFINFDIQTSVPDFETLKLGELMWMKLAEAFEGKHC